MTIESKELTILDEFKILEVYKYDVIERAAEAIETEVMSEVCDVTDPKGRERERSLAHKVSQAKSRVVKMANGSIEDARATVKAVTGERMRLEARFDGIRDKRKEASVKWKFEEDERVERWKARIAAIRSLIDLSDTTSEEIAAKLERAKEADVTEMGKYEPEILLVKAETVSEIKKALEVAKQRESDAAELKKLQDEAAERKVEDEKREAKEKADKVEADRKEREIKEADEKREALAKQAHMDMLKAEADKLAAEEADKQRQIDEDARVEKAKADAIKATEDRLAKIQKDMDDIDKENADRAESDRLAKENAELKRKADKDHRATVRDEAREDMEVSEGDFIDLIHRIENGQVRHVTINF